MGAPMRYQPQGLQRINRSSPLSRGLIQAFSGYRQYDAAALKPYIPIVAPKAVAEGVEFSMVNASLMRLASPAEKTNSFTLAILVKALGDSSAYAAIAGVTYDSAGNPPYGDQFDRGGNGRSLRFAYNCNGNAAAIGETAGINVSSTAFEWVIGTFTSGAQVLYKNLTQIASAADVGNPSYTATSQVNIGPTTNDGRNPNLIVKAVMRWNRVLSQSEMAALAANPWQIWEAPEDEDLALASATNTQINPGVGSISVAGFSPTVTSTANQAVAPASGTVTFAGYAPAVTQSSATTVNPSAGSLAISGYSPVVSRTVSQFVAPSSGSISISGYAPTVAQIPVGTIAPQAGSFAITGYAPAVSRTANSSITISVGQISINGYAPTIFQGATGATPQLNLYTIMRQPQINLTASLGEPINLTGNLL